MTAQEHTPGSHEAYKRSQRIVRKVIRYTQHLAPGQTVHIPFTRIKRVFV